MFVLENEESHVIVDVLRVTGQSY